MTKEIRYHPICRTELQNHAELKSYTQIQSVWHNTRDMHAVPFEEVNQSVKTHVIGSDEAHSMKNLLSNYYSISVAVGGPSFKDVALETAKGKHCL